MSGRFLVVGVPKPLNCGIPAKKTSKKTVLVFRFFSSPSVNPRPSESTSQNLNLLAAEGYVELGMLEDALEEIQDLPEKVADSLDCLEVRVKIHREAAMRCFKPGQA